MAKICYDNLARRAELPAVPTAGSSAPGVPTSRLLSDHLSARWRSVPGVQDTWIQVDLQDQGWIDTVAALTNLNAATSTRRIRIGHGDLTVPGNCLVDTGAEAAGVVDPYGLTVKYLAEPVLASAVRIDLADWAAPFIECGRVWIGQSWQPQHNYSFGYSFDPEDYSTQEYTPYGVLFGDERDIARGWSLPFRAITPAELDTHVERLQRLVGKSRELLVCLDETSPRIGAKTMVCVMRGRPVTASHEQPGRVAMTLNVLERLP